MKLNKIFAILGVILFFSCNPIQKKEVTIKKAQVLDNIAILREAGFFEKYKELTDLEVYDEIYESRKKRISKYTTDLGNSTDPGMELYPIKLAQEDFTKALHIDAEADVMIGNERYVWTINAFSKLSNGKFKPKEIQENWQTEIGPIRVTFESEDSIIVFEPEYKDDWLHESVFLICEQELKKRNIRIVRCLSEGGDEGYGHNIVIMRLTEAEQNILEKKLHWKFSLI